MVQSGHMLGGCSPDSWDLTTLKYLQALQQSAVRIYPRQFALILGNTAGSIVYLLERRIITYCDNIAGLLGSLSTLLKYPHTTR